jgi:hypothetical protein
MPTTTDSLRTTTSRVLAALAFTALATCCVGVAAESQSANGTGNSGKTQDAQVIAEGVELTGLLKVAWNKQAKAEVRLFVDTGDGTNAVYYVSPRGQGARLMRQMAGKKVRVTCSIRERDGRQWVGVSRFAPVEGVGRKTANGTRRRDNVPDGQKPAEQP